MIKQLFSMVIFSIISLNSFAVPIQLDFSSGTYNTGNSIYYEDDFTVSASNGFHSVRTGALAWYETDNLINISSDTGIFDLESLVISNRAFLGLVFESSKGGSVTVGSISGFLSFSGVEWREIDYFSIRTGGNSFDVLNQIDNIVLDVKLIPEPPTIFLVILASLFVRFFVQRVAYTRMLYK